MPNLDTQETKEENEMKKYCLPPLRRRSDGAAQASSVSSPICRQSKKGVNANSRWAPTGPGHVRGAPVPCYLAASAVLVSDSGATDWGAGAVKSTHSRMALWAASPWRWPGFTMRV